MQDQVGHGDWFRALCRNALGRLAIKIFIGLGIRHAFMTAFVGATHRRPFTDGLEPALHVWKLMERLALPLV